MNVMIVDDEWASVDVLKTEIDWAEYGFEEVLCAFNSSQAIKQFEQSTIELLVCDIEMPGGNGLELAEWVKTHSPATLIIFLTCHDKFPFALKALQLGSYDYLLKPIEFDKFNSILSRAVTDIRQHQNQYGKIEELEKYNYLWHNKKSDLVEKFWQDLLGGRIARKQDKIESALLPLLRSPFRSFDVVPILISIERWHRAFEQMDEEILEYAIRSAAIDIVLGKHEGIAFQDHNGNNILLVYIYSGDQVESRELQAACESLIQECDKLFYCDVSCYVGWQAPIVDVMRPYNALRYEEQNSLAVSRQVIALKGDANAASASVVQMPDFIEWGEWISSGKDRKLNEAIQEVTAQLTGIDVLTIDLQRFQRDMAIGLLYALRKKGHSEAAEFEKDLMILVNQSITVSGFRRWIEHVVQLARKYMRGLEEEDNVVHTVKKMIRSSLSEELSREELASAVHLNPGYLSRLFKKETGYSITDYITNERMKHAAELLRTKASIMEIAMATGYSYQSHFSKMFKKTFQMSPQEYRNVMRSSHAE